MEAALKSNNIKTEIQPAIKPLVVDAFAQTDVVSRENEACQTEKSTGIDFEVQANLHPERRILCTRKIKVEAGEIAMPNLLSSSSSKTVNKGQQARKRKRSSTSVPNEYNCRVVLSNYLPKPDNETDEEDSDITVDESVLRSKVYQIYDQYEDPNKAKKAIKKMGNLNEFHEPSHKLTNSEERLKIMIESLWQVPPSLNQIKQYVENGVVKYINKEKQKEFTFPWECFTRISFVKANGFECWYIKDFDKGPGKSKWYRGYAVKIAAAWVLAQLGC